MEQLSEVIKKARRVTVTTHRDCDGDGVGAMLAFYHALKKLNINVRILSVDSIPKKYSFLPGFESIEIFHPEKSPDIGDLLIAFDTNDSRRIEPLASWAEKSGEVMFIDHHPILENGPRPGIGSLINIKAASTGEMAFDLIQFLKVEMDASIAQCLYTSIAFDTQLFRFIRKSPRSHQIAAELMIHSFDPTEIHRKLFGNQSPEKLRFLAKALSEIEYLHSGQVAYLSLRLVDFTQYQVDPEASRDVVDMMMNVEGVEIAVLIREESKSKLKVSLRSKGRIEVLSLAETWEGGGHLYAAGATLENVSVQTLHQNLLDWLKIHL